MTEVEMYIEEGERHSHRQASQDIDQSGNEDAFPDDSRSQYEDSGILPPSIEEEIRELKRQADKAAVSNLTTSQLAEPVRKDENGPNAERSRQIFGMCWLLRSCEEAPDVAVPRNKIYGNYVSICNSENIKQLNPASFGKLVRMVFPAIKTRRLGVRGNSKYHYCGVHLRGEPSIMQKFNKSATETAAEILKEVRASTEESMPEQGSAASNHINGTNHPKMQPRYFLDDDRKSDGAHSHQRHNSHDGSTQRLPSHENLSAKNHRIHSIQTDHQTNESTVLGPPLPSPIASSPVRPSSNPLPTSSTSMIPQPSHSSSRRSKQMLSPHPTSDFLRDIYLQFPNVQSDKLDYSTTPQPTSSAYRDIVGDVNDTFVLPLVDIQDSSINHKLLKDLILTYQDHCTALIKAFRFMQMKKLYAQISSFYSSLSAETKEIFILDSMIPWIHKSEMAMYRMILGFLSPLSLQVIPPTVISLLKTSSQTLESNYREALIGFPEKAVDAIVEPARAFAALITRLLRVNETAHAAARFLTNHANRELMRSDWAKIIDAEAILLREFAFVHPAAVSVMAEDIPSLLQDTALLPPSLVTNGTTFSPSSDAMHTAHNSPEGALEHWTNYLASLPSKFSDLPPRLFLVAMNALGSSILREITLSDGQSFGAWWVVKCWVDEWMSWIGEQTSFIR